jgi:hypothetical protein
MEDVSKINMQKLKALVLKGASPGELLNELNIADSTVLSAALLELLRSEQEADEEEDVGRVEHYAMNPAYEKDGIHITPDMLKDTGFKEGDEFGLTVEEDRIILDKSSIRSVGPL